MVTSTNLPWVKGGSRRGKCTDPCPGLESWVWFVHGRSYLWYPNGVDTCSWNKRHEGRNQLGCAEAQVARDICWLAGNSVQVSIGNLVGSPRQSAVRWSLCASSGTVQYPLFLLNHTKEQSQQKPLDSPQLSAFILAIFLSSSRHLWLFLAALGPRYKTGKQYELISAGDDQDHMGPRALQRFQRMLLRCMKKCIHATHQELI